MSVPPLGKRRPRAAPHQATLPQPPEARTPRCRGRPGTRGGRWPDGRIRGDAGVRRRPRWQDAAQAAGRVTDGEPHLLLLLARLPLPWVEVIQRLSGLRGPVTVYRRMGRLRRAGLLASGRIRHDDVVQTSRQSIRLRDGRQASCSGYVTRAGLGLGWQVRQVSPSGAQGLPGCSQLLVASLSGTGLAHSPGG